MLNTIILPMRKLIDYIFNLDNFILKINYIKIYCNFLFIQINMVMPISFEK